jgi:3-oxoacyl-(acyl-carrier-protein) synthase
LASEAIAECISGLAPDIVRKPALILCVGESYRDSARKEDASDALVDDIQGALGIRFGVGTRILGEGNASVIAALIEARNLLDAGQVDECVVGGVDSFLNVDDLRRFEAAYRLKQKGVGQGFIPGEGAAFVRVAAVGSQPGEDALAEIAGIGIAREDVAVTVLSDGHPTGDGLRRALQAALVDGEISEADIIFRVSDLNGEQYRGIESMLAMSRVYRTHRDDIPVLLPAASIGETGAAAGAFLVLLAALGLSSGHAPGRVAMCEASSDSGLRAGCVIRAASRTP